MVNLYHGERPIDVTGEGGRAGGVIMNKGHDLSAPTFSSECSIAPKATSDPFWAAVVTNNILLYAVLARGLT